MIARNNFRVSLYKLILLKNIVETKVHKEKMQVLFAFEQLIINTEDQHEDASFDAQEPQFIDGSADPTRCIEEALA